MRVQDRHTGRMIDETIPSYLRSVYRVMYQNPVGRKLIKFPVTTAILRRATAQHGAKMDHPDSANQIAKFIETYGVNVEEVELPLSSYVTFNDFFARRLKAGARPLAGSNDPSVLVSPADCRLLVFPSVEDTTRLWLKGQDFTIASLLGPKFKQYLQHFKAPAVAIARLAPQDYHRWHMPADATVGPRASVDGTYFSVSPRAVREVNILCTNKREVCMFDSGPPESGQPGAIGKWCMIAVGAAMVSSIVVDESMQEGAQVAKGDEHGCFRFGGSTLILLFDAHAIAWDDDLVAASRKPIETYVRCGTQIGRTRAVRRQEEAAAAAAAQMRRPPPFDVTAMGAVAPARVLSPSPSPTSPRLVLTATTDAGRKEAALNDEGLLSDMPVLQSNLTLMPRDGDTEPARGVPHMTDAAADAADAVNADVPDRGEERSVGESLEAFLPSFLQSSSSPSPPSSPEEDHSRDLESPSSRRGLLESHRAEWQQQDASSRSRGAAAAAAAAGSSGRLRIEDETHVRAPAPAVFQLMHFTADEDSSSASSGEEDDEHDEEMGAREDGAAAQHYQQREEPNQAARAHSNNSGGDGSRKKRVQSQPQHPSASGAAAAAAPSSSSSASATSSPSRQAGRRRSRASAAADNGGSSSSRRGNSASSRMEDTEAASIEDEQQDNDEELPAAKKKKRASRSRK